VLLAQSSLANVGETVRRLRAEGFRVRILARKRLFFEELCCVEAFKQRST